MESQQAEHYFSYFIENMWGLCAVGTTETWATVFLFSFPVFSFWRPMYIPPAAWTLLERGQEQIQQLFSWGPALLESEYLF